jgi:predicted acyltransferase
MQNQRDLSLDAFRGLTVLLMIIVNIQGNGDVAYAALKHAEWDGLTLADLVFPWFLFIVGLSVPLALDRAHSGSPWPAILRRALVLFALGVILSWLIRPVDLHHVRWMGVLQRIGIVYLACAAIALLRPGWKLAVGLAIVILGLHSWLIFVPVDGVSSLIEGAGLNASLDQQLLAGRLLRKTWDPEGVLSTLPAIASGLLGVAVMRSRSVRSSCFSFGAAFGIGGLLLGHWIPINKALWTASFVLMTAGLALMFWTALSYFWQKVGNTALARFAVLLGQTALTLYVIHMLLLAIIVRKLPDDTRIWDMLYSKLAAIIPSPPLASLIFALIAGALCVAPLAWLKRKGWLIKA